MYLIESQINKQELIIVPFLVDWMMRCSVGLNGPESSWSTTFFFFLKETMSNLYAGQQG